MKVSSNTVLTREHLEEVVEYFMRPENDAFVFDVESMPGSAPRNVPTGNNVVWIALATYGRTVVIPMGHPNGNTLIRKATRRKNKATNKFDIIPALYSAPPEQLSPSEVFDALKPLFFSDKIKIAHNATFDFISVEKYFGAVPFGPMQDTITIQHLLNENLKQKGLKALVEKYWSVKYDHEDVGKCIEAHPFKTVAHYAFMDAKYTWLLWKRLEPFIFMKDKQGYDLSKVHALESDLLPVLCDMGVEGAPVDEEALVALEAELSDLEVDVLARTYKAAGKKFNLNAAGQKAEILGAGRRGAGGP